MCGYRQVVELHNKGSSTNKSTSVKKHKLLMNVSSYSLHIGLEKYFFLPFTFQDQFFHQRLQHSFINTRQNQINHIYMIGAINTSI